MKKAKINIITEIDDHVVTEKYICSYDQNTIEYKDKQKTLTKLIYNQEHMQVIRSGHVNYKLQHDGSSKASSEFHTKVDGQPFSMMLNIENKSYIISKCDKILSIEIQFLREDNCLVKQTFKVEEK